MKRFIIEREIPGASELTESQLAEIPKTSNAAAASLARRYFSITFGTAWRAVRCTFTSRSCRHSPTPYCRRRSWRIWPSSAAATSASAIARCARPDDGSAWKAASEPAAA